MNGLVGSASSSRYTTRSTTQYRTTTRHDSSDDGGSGYRIRIELGVTATSSSSLLTIKF